MTPKLILTGFMATGKSSVGPIVARRLGWEFVDVDAIVIARAGKPIAQIFADQGEAHRLVKSYPPMPVTDLPR